MLRSASGFDERLALLLVLQPCCDKPRGAACLPWREDSCTVARPAMLTVAPSSSACVAGMLVACLSLPSMLVLASSAIACKVAELQRGPPLACGRALWPVAHRDRMYPFVATRISRPLSRNFAERNKLKRAQLGELEGCPLVNVGEGLGGAGPFQGDWCCLVGLLQKLRYIFSR